MNAHPRIQSYTCPCCKGFIGEAAPIEEVIEGMHGGYARVILERLAKRLGRYVSRDDLIFAMYGHDPQGGPDTANMAVNVHLHRLRRRIAPFGWSIVLAGKAGAGSRDGGVYKLIPTEAGQ